MVLRLTLYVRNNIEISYWVLNIKVIWGTLRLIRDGVSCFCHVSVAFWGKIDGSGASLKYVSVHVVSNAVVSPAGRI